MNIPKSTFYILSFTWGLPITLIGLIVAFLLIISGKRPSRFGPCLHFEVGKNWGGASLGLFLLTYKQAPEKTKAHELGHSLQNCLFGFIMPFAVSFPSAARYWFWRIKERCGCLPQKGYHDIWFERQASNWGNSWIKKSKVPAFYINSPALTITANAEEYIPALKAAGAEYRIVTEGYIVFPGKVFHYNEPLMIGLQFSAGRKFIEIFRPSEYYQSCSTETSFQELSDVLRKEYGAPQKSGTTYDGYFQGKKEKWQTESLIIEHYIADHFGPTEYLHIHFT